ncbi:hypothetical protein [Streptomyces sp. NPDC005876]|uniref:hypothetical protein n=1 Tax=unclassified Streptomyces TaxID=2593676 RepID=UPI00340BB7ED
MTTVSTRVCPAKSPEVMMPVDTRTVVPSGRSARLLVNVNREGDVPGLLQVMLPCRHCCRPGS